MASLTRLAWFSILMAALAAPADTQPRPAADTTIAAIDLAKPFETRSAWSFLATQGLPVDGLFGDQDKISGDIRLCLRQEAAAPCDPQLDSHIGGSPDNDFYSRPHYLRRAQIVHTASGLPMLLVQVAGAPSGDGNQGVFTQVLVYRRGPDQFSRVYGHVTGTNNNQEVRYIESGQLKGDIVSAEPTENAPFGFWLTINAFTSAGTYKQVLRYRSATTYGDGNPLSVVDSEMPNIERRLGLWRPGQALPLPTGPCPKPHMIGMELWCR